MPKEKMSMTIEEDAAAMLRHAADAEGESVSAIAEKAIRHYCINYSNHRVELVVAIEGGVGVTVERQGRVIYKYRPVPRYTSHGVKGVVTVSTDGPLNRSEVLSVLGSPPRWRPEQVESGQALEFRSGRYNVRVSDLTLEADSNPGHVRALLDRVAAAVADLEVMSLADVSNHRCPRCGSWVTELRRWAGSKGGPDEIEWVCFVGHHERMDHPST